MLLIALGPKEIIIYPQTEPEMVFLCDSSSLPEDPGALDLCKQNNIAFMPVINEALVGSDTHINKYKAAIARGINLYFLLFERHSYTDISNAYYFQYLYLDIRDWFINEGIMDSPYIYAFLVDAEPNFDSLDIISTYPSRSEILIATEALQNFTNLIKADGKKSGMVQSSLFLDSADQDWDYSLLMRNIYSLPVEWDFTIAMLYRTSDLQYDESNADPPQFITKSMELFYDGIIEGTKFTTSELSFYQNVAFEMNSDDDLAKDHYIFIGDFDYRYKNIKYIEEKEYLMDLDICRHFGNEKVFFYHLTGFLAHYDGWNEIILLGQHVRQKSTRSLEYSIYKSLTFLILYCGLIILDIFASFENDLT